MRSENRRLRQSLEAASRSATAARRLAHHDVLTGLPNRLFLMESLERAIAAACVQGRRLALLFIDLDDFKAVNDRFGHLVADRLLAAVASRIAGCVRAGDVASRYGGDEFVALLTDLSDSSIAVGVAQKVREHIAEDFAIAGHRIQITASIGLAVYPEQGILCDTLLDHADTDMYRDKACRRGASTRARRKWGAGRNHSARAGNPNLDPVLAAIIDERNACVADVDAI